VADGCWVYGKRVADEHLWPYPTLPGIQWLHGAGPLCLRCGLPQGTWQWEAYAARHRARTGHGLETGACEERCQTDADGGRSLNTGLHWTVYTTNDDTEWQIGEWAYGVWFPGSLADALRNLDLLGEPGHVRGRLVRA
jgi:hypothetical protein